MVSGLTIEEKKAIVINTLIPMLKNDLHRVVDCTSPEHRTPGQDQILQLLCFA